MARIVVMNAVTLDGVMQGPGRPDEDTRGGFEHGGWALRTSGVSEAMTQAMGERMAAGGGLHAWLFGRRTYEDLLAIWNERGGPFRDALNTTPKYVASRHRHDGLRWPNSTPLDGDAVAAVSDLKARSAGVLGIMGSGELIASLMVAGLIDEFLLAIHPLVLGGGRRLFPEGVQAALRLVEGRLLPSGALIASYEPQLDRE